MITIKRLNFVFSMLLIMLLLVVFSISVMANYPTRAVRAIVPYGAGGSSDLVARAIVADIASVLGRPIIIENVVGASGAIGATRVASADPDGYTILMAPTNVIAINPNLIVDPPYILGKLEPLVGLTKDPRVIVARADAPWNNIADVVQGAIENPGTIRFASPGVTSWGAFGGYALEAVIEGVEFHYVPLGGGAEVTSAILRGDADLAAGSFAQYKAQVDAGEFKAIGVANVERSFFLPDVPTYIEVGIDVPSDFNTLYVYVPREVPEAIKNKLAEAFEDIVQDPGVKERMERLNSELRFMGREETILEAYRQNWLFKGLIESFGLEIE